jgi:hypothetical protein
VPGLTRRPVHREELRQRFLKAERELFRIRFETDDPQERRSFVESLNFGWEKVNRHRPAVAVLPRQVSLTLLSNLRSRRRSRIP